MKHLSNSELRLLYLRRGFLAEFIQTTALQAKGHLGDSWERTLTRIRAVREEIKAIVEDPQFDVLVSLPTTSVSRSHYSPGGSMVNAIATAKELSAYIDGILSLYLNPKAEELKREPNASPKIFIGYGHSAVVRHKVKDFIRERCGCEPLVLEELPSSGMTVIEKLEKFGRLADYAVFILTGDDAVEGEQGSRARQNVIQELGWFQGVLGRKRTAILRQSGVEIASNLNGIVYLGFERDSVESTFVALQKELEEAELL